MLWENRPVKVPIRVVHYLIMVEIISSENDVRYIKERSYFLEDGPISGYFDTKNMTVLQIEHIFHNFEDQKIAGFFST